MKKRLWLLSIPLLLFTLAGCSVKPPQGLYAINDFQLDHYLGTWYEMARLDNSFEQGLTQVNATYQIDKKGNIQVINKGYNTKTQQWQQAIGKAKFVGDQNVGALKVSFFGPFYGGYNILAIDPNYQYALVCGKDWRYLWILSKDKTLPTQYKKAFLNTAEKYGFNINNLIWQQP